MLAPQLACPRDGHLEAIHRIFACLDNKQNSRMVFDPMHAEIQMSSFKECDWRELHRNVSSLRRQTCLNLVVRRLRFVCMLILTMPVTNWFLCVSKFSTTDLVFELTTVARTHTHTLLFSSFAYYILFRYS